MGTDRSVEALAQAIRNDMRAYNASYDSKTSRHTLEPNQAAANAGVDRRLQVLIGIMIESRLPKFSNWADEVLKPTRNPETYEPELDWRTE